jgi:NitT/TauT family transport system substrate-binding protein
MSKRIKIGLLIFVVCVAAIVYYAVIGSSKEDSRIYSGPIEKITVAAYEGEASLLLYIAKEYGFFEQNGLDVTILGFESGKAAADALLAGAADLSTSASGVLVSYSFDHPDLRALATIATINVQGLIARKDRGITSPTDLIGKKLGVTKKSHGEFNLGIFLTLNSLSINEVEIVDLSPSEIVEKLVSGEIDAGFTWEPNLYKAKALLGDNALVIKKDVPEFHFAILSTVGWVDNNTSAAERFVGALVQAEGYVAQNDEEAQQLMRGAFNYEQAYSLETWGNHDFSVVLSQSFISELEEIARWMIKNKLTDIVEIPNYLDYIYFDALEGASLVAVSIIR